MARSHRDWCQKVCLSTVVRQTIFNVSQQNLEAWQEAKQEIDKISDHPNKAPEEEIAVRSPTQQNPGAIRRDSTATINGR